MTCYTINSGMVMFKRKRIANYQKYVFEQNPLSVLVFVSFRHLQSLKVELEVLWHVYGMNNGGGGGENQ